MPPIERAVVPPNQCARSRTITLSPACAATNAHVIPAAPEPITTTSASMNALSLMPLDGRTHLLLFYFESAQARGSRDPLLRHLPCVEWRGGRRICFGRTSLRRRRLFDLKACL